MRSKTYKKWLVIALVFSALAVISYFCGMYKDKTAGEKADALLIEFDLMLEKKEKLNNFNENTIQENDSEEKDLNSKENNSEEKNLNSEENNSDEISEDSDAHDSSKYIPIEEIYNIMGKIYIPELDIKLPIIAEYSDELLKAAPCRYFGPDIGEKGHLVILGHNYKRHFGKLTIIKEGTKVTLTDIDGNQYNYEVYEVEIVKPEQSEALEKYEGERGLTLVTCADFEGKERTIIRCKEIKQIIS